MKAKKIKKTFRVGDKEKCEVKIWISMNPIENQGCYFVSHGRRIHECHEIKSFMKSSVARWSCWSHPNLVGFIEVGDIVEPVITRDEFRRTQKRSELYKLIVTVVEPIIVDNISKVNKKRRVLEMGRLGNILSKCFNTAVKKDNQRSKGLSNYLDQMQGKRATGSGKRKLPEEWKDENPDPNPEDIPEDLPEQPNLNPEENQDVQEPEAKRQKREKKIDKLKRVSGKFDMIFVSELKDAKGRLQRALLVGENMYINVSHPDFSERIHTNRARAKLTITERLCSYIAGICANAYKFAIISRSSEGLAMYSEKQSDLFTEILDLNLSMESTLRKYLPAIQKEVQK